VTMILFFLSLIFPLIALADENGESYPNFPGFTYGNVSNYSGGEEENPGNKFDGYIEQGVDWFRFGSNGPIFNTFVGLSGTFSDKEERWWDNSWGPSGGGKLKVLLPGLGEVSLGVRIEQKEYLDSSSPISNETLVVAFVQWYAGWDLRNLK